jgi:hypothetical protein
MKSSGKKSKDGGLVRAMIGPLALIANAQARLDMLRFQRDKSAPLASVPALMASSTQKQ